MRKQSFILEACHMPGIVVGCHLLCLGSCLARGVVLQLFVQTYHRLLSAFLHFYNQSLFNSFRQVIWLECESKFSLEFCHSCYNSLYRPTIGYFQHVGTSITNAYSTHFVKSSGLNAKAKFHYFQRIDIQAITLTPPQTPRLTCTTPTIASF